MRIVCWQTILMKHHTLFFFKIGKDVTKFVVCCSCDWRFTVCVLCHFLVGALSWSVIVVHVFPGHTHLFF